LAAVGFSVILTLKEVARNERRARRVEGPRSVAARVDERDVVVWFMASVFVSFVAVAGCLAA